MLIASLSLVAFPFMTGFYSKDFILESAFGQFSFSGVAVYTIATIGAIFTTLYSVKVLYLTFLTSPNGGQKFYNKPKTYFGESVFFPPRYHYYDV
jgi:NADH-ubiquinone oxidoreductase chain 5